MTETTSLIDWIITGGIILAKILIIVVPLMLCVAYLTYAERKIIGYMQMRIGPNRVGPRGWLQPIADAVKLMFKEVIVPAKSNYYLFVIAPTLSIGPALAAWAVIPFDDGLVLADVDRFKQFNDQYGHACGDHVLKRVGAILEERTRDIDRVARWGGEEFILLLPETSTEGAAVLAENLREVIADTLFEFGGERLGITMTFGIAIHRKGESLDACIARADTALYTGKERGRNRVMIGNYKGLTLVN